MIRVVVAEDAYLVREGIRRLLEPEPDIEVAAACEDLPSLLAAIDSEEPDVVLTDIRMPPTSRDEGIQVADRLRETSPETGVVVLSQFAAPEYALALLEKGADRRAYLLKDRVGDVAQLAGAIREVARGGSVIDPKIVEALVTARARGESPLDELRAAVQEAMQDFRDLAHGIYPPLLQDRGLSEALANAARRTTIPTRVEPNTRRRYDPEVEATVYFCCLEALQNAGKHAGDRARVMIRLYEEEDALLFEIADDGSGFDPSRTTFGAGLTNMRDRLEAIGGDLRIDSNLGQGSRVLGTIPLKR